MIRPLTPISVPVIDRQRQSLAAAWAVLGLVVVLGADCCLAAGPRVTVERLDAPPLSGELVQLGGAELVIDTADGRQKLPSSSVLLVNPTATSEAPAKVTAPVAAAGKPVVQVEWIDGSQAMATDFQVKREQASITLVGGETLQMPTRSIHYVHCEDAPPEKGSSDKRATEWSQYVSHGASADVLVVRKQGALDALEGVVGDIDAETVQFELDKESIPVKRSKVEGLIYYHPAGDAPADPVAVAVDRSGGRWQAKSLAFEGDQVKIRTVAGLNIVRSSPSLSIDFSSVNTQYLSELEPEKFEYSPYFAPRADLPVLGEASRPRQNVGWQGQPLKLDGKTYPKGLALHSRSVVHYRLPAKFRRLKGVVGIDDAVRDSGDLQLEIRGDDKVLWQGRIRGTEPSQSLDVDLKNTLKSTRRLEIVVDFGADLDVGDVLDLCDLRVTK